MTAPDPKATASRSDPISRSSDSRPWIPACSAPVTTHYRALSPLAPWSRLDRHSIRRAYAAAHSPERIADSSDAGRLARDRLRLVPVSVSTDRESSRSTEESGNDWSSEHRPRPRRVGRGSCWSGVIGVCRSRLQRARPQFPLTSLADDCRAPSQCCIPGPSDDRRWTLLRGQVITALGTDARTWLASSTSPRSASTRASRSERCSRRGL